MSDWREKYRVPAWCPLCARLMKGDKSTNSYYEFDCCSDCHIAFVDGREEKWNSGTRPSKEVVEKYYKKMDERRF